MQKETEIKSTKRPLPDQKQISKKFKQEKMKEQEDQLIQKAIACMDNAATKKTDKEDEFNIFGKYVANEVLSIADVKTQRWVKWTIQNSLYAAQCENPLYVQQTTPMAMRTLFHIQTVSHQLPHFLLHVHHLVVIITIKLCMLN